LRKTNTLDPQEAALGTNAEGGGREDSGVDIIKTV